MFGVLFLLLLWVINTLCLLLMTLLGWVEYICLSLRMMFYMLFLNFPKLLSHNLILRLSFFTLTIVCEFVNQSLADLFKENGILHQTTCTYMPQQNNIAECKNNHILEVALALHFTLRVPKLLSWGHPDYYLSHQPNVCSCHWLSNPITNIITISLHSFYFEFLS